MKNALWILLLVSSSSMASTIAVVDSGVDNQHKDLLAKIWMNENEIADNGRDEDGNGYQDDIYGWNFAESNNRVIERKYIGTFSNDPYKFFDIQGKNFLGQATQEELDWIKAKFQDDAFRKEMGIFGNFVHGTHVAGITANGNDEAKVLAVKLIPTEVKPFLEGLKSTQFNKADDKNARMKILKGMLKTLAGEQMKMLEEIATYVGNHKADVANGSFGTGFNQAKVITENAFKIVFFRKPTDEESYEVTKYFMDSLIEAGQTMVAASPNTLWVFAAGNDGSNNDEFPTSPTNIIADNVISVAATYKYEFIAPFSNYGTKNVDVAAPGMLIHSTIPGDEYLKVSGTSQAAPYVANVAAVIKDQNNKLTPKEIKQIILGTVDEKGYLSTKVKTSGIVNLNRAAHAAKLSITMDLGTAISQANVSVSDVQTSKTKSMVNPFAIVPIPLINQFTL